MKLVAEALDFGYPGRSVGRDLTLRFAAGEVLALLGPNGSGKTTLLRTLLGLLPKQGGRLRLDDAELETLPRAAAARRLSYVPQAQATFFPYSLREVVLMGRTAHLGLFAVPSRRDRELADAAIARMGLSALAAMPYPRVSGGERQLALIARALAQAATLMVMDEPTASLDFGNRLRVLAQVRVLADAGYGVLLSTHDPDQAFLCADRVALLRDGRLIACGAPREVISEANLRALYGVEVAVTAVKAGSVERRVCLPLNFGEPR
jgi:iron complex transport system ATP-binding protein